MATIRLPTGCSLIIDQRGSAPQAVFVHGLGGDLHTWDALWRALPPDRPLARYDLRGFGGSVALDDQPFSHGDDLAALLDALAIDRCDLIGVSMGGSITLSFALDHPGRVRSLTLISPSITAWEWSDDWRARWTPMIEAAKAGRFDEARRLLWEHPLFETTRASPAAALLHDEIMRSPATQWADDRHRLMLPDVERLHDLKTPTLLLSGGRDLDELRLMADLIAGCGQAVTRHDRPDLGHLLHLEDPAWCAAEIEGFIKSF